MTTEPRAQTPVDQQKTQPDARALPRHSREHPLAVPVITRRALIERQPTIPIRRQPQAIEQQQTLPMARKSKKRSSRYLRGLIPLILGITLLIASFVLQAIFINSPHKNLKSALLHSQAVHANGPRVNQAAQQFMRDFMQKDWAGLWSMLSPDAQHLWQGENDFVHFEQSKFGSLHFISYTDGSSQTQHAWLDPDTTQQYASAVTFQVTLDATAPAGLLSTPSNLALNQGLFKNTLLALIQYKGNWRVLVAGPADLDAPILVPAVPPAVKLLVPIFMYHHVSNKPTTNVLDYNLTVTTTDFNAQLNWLQQNGYSSITQTELFDAFYYGKALPKHPVILSFDDGYEDVYTDALPALLAHHFRGVFYIITGMIGGSYMTWPQVRTLAKDGMQVASHTVHHVNIGEPPAWTSTQQELLQSKATLEAQIGQPVQFFCYPSGEPFHHDPVAEQQIVLSDLYNDGYVSATLDPFSIFSAVQDAQIPYQLPRIRVSGGETLASFVGILSYTLQAGGQELAS
jgi:peptidoglycan/xylan/chitin deacetylase (PgdA/CDA1 family)